VASAVRPYKMQADRHEQLAAIHDHKIALRSSDHQAAIRTNQATTDRHHKLLAAAETGRAAIADSLEVRAARVETLTPQQLAVADLQRLLYVAEQARERQIIAQREHALQMQPPHLVPTIQHSGPTIQI
jgi:hypothetical protein